MVAPINPASRSVPQPAAEPSKATPAQSASLDRLAVSQSLRDSVLRDMQQPPRRFEQPRVSNPLEQDKVETTTGFYKPGLGFPTTKEMSVGNVGLTVNGTLKPDGSLNKESGLSSVQVSLPVSGGVSLFGGADKSGFVGGRVELKDRNSSVGLETKTSTTTGGTTTKLDASTKVGESTVTAGVTSGNDPKGSTTSSELGVSNGQVKVGLGHNEKTGTEFNVLFDSKL